jgi:hypothetical protein
MAAQNRNLPWCPNCKSSIGPDDFGILNRANNRVLGYTLIDPAVIFCRKCGVIFGAQAGDVQAR